MTMDKKQIATMIGKIAKLEAKGDADEAGSLKQELFTDGIDYPEIEKMVKKASKKRATKPNGTFKPDDKTTPDKNEAYETGKKPEAKKPGMIAKGVAAVKKAVTKKKTKAKAKAKAKGRTKK